MVPAFNEERTIADVVGSLVGIPDSDLVVVDDGSTDETARRARDAGARVIRLTRNVGKGGALDVAVRDSSSRILVFLDADVSGMTREKVLALVQPVQNGAVMCVGVRYALYEYLDNALPWLPVVAKLSGQRCIDRRLWTAARPYCNGYGVESALNAFASRLGKIAYIHLPGLSHTIKESKRGILPGLLERCKMAAQVVYYSLRTRIHGTRSPRGRTSPSCRRTSQE